MKAMYALLGIGALGLLAMASTNTASTGWNSAMEFKSGSRNYRVSRNNHEMMIQELEFPKGVLVIDYRTKQPIASPGHPTPIPATLAHAQIARMALTDRVGFGLSLEEAAILAGIVKQAKAAAAAKAAQAKG